MFFALAGVELARYLALTIASGPYTSSSLVAPHVLRLIAAPNALFAVAFFFLGRNATRYEAYRPLLVVGKLMTIFSGALAVPGLLGFSLDASTSGSNTIPLLGVIVWDAIALAVLLFSGRKPSEPKITVALEPERVEID